jgi:hypothetical protein
VRYFEHRKKTISILGYSYPAKLSFRIERGIKTFPDKQKQKQNMITEPILQKTLKGILHIANENKQP